MGSKQKSGKFFRILFLGSGIILTLGILNQCNINGTPDSDSKAVDIPGDPDNENGDVAGPDPFLEVRKICVEIINNYRATEGKTPYSQWLEGEPCADEQAKYDYEAGRAHAGWGANICSPKGWAQNECGGRSGGDVAASLAGCLKSMWNEKENPGGEQGHYRAMSSVDREEVACGFYKMPDGRVWMLQNFR